MRVPSLGIIRHETGECEPRVSRMRMRGPGPGIMRLGTEENGLFQMFHPAFLPVHQGGIFWAFFFENWHKP